MARSRSTTRSTAALVHDQALGVGPELGAQRRVSQQRSDGRPNAPAFTSQSQPVLPCSIRVAVPDDVADDYGFGMTRIFSAAT